MLASEELLPAYLVGGVRSMEPDKAVYEVVYRGSSDPDWVEAPRRAIRRLANG